MLKAPLRWTSWTRSHSCSLIFLNDLSRMMPALLRSTCTPLLNADRASWTIAPAPSVTEWTEGTALPPAAVGRGRGGRERSVGVSQGPGRRRRGAGDERPSKGSSSRTLDDLVDDGLRVLCADVVDDDLCAELSVVERVAARGDGSAYWVPGGKAGTREGGARRTVNAHAADACAGAGDDDDLVLEGDGRHPGGERVGVGVLQGKVGEEREGMVVVGVRVGRTVAC